MSVLLTLAKVTGGLSVVGLVTSSPFLVKSFSGSLTVGGVGSQRRSEGNCWQILAGNDEIEGDKSGDEERYLLACRTDSTNPETKYYLSIGKSSKNLQEVEKVKIENQIMSVKVTLFLLSPSDSRKKEEIIRISHRLNLGEELNLKEGCRVDWAESDGKWLTCTENSKNIKEALERFDFVD